MGGGILQLVAYGIQDLIFSQNPDITFFKTSYNRYTNFTIDQQLLDFSSKVEFNKKAQCIIKRNADLVGKSYLRIELPELVAKFNKCNVDRVLELLNNCDIKLTKNDILYNINSIINFFITIICKLEQLLVSQNNLSIIKTTLLDLIDTNKIENTIDEYNVLVIKFKEDFTKIIDNIDTNTFNTFEKKQFLLDEVKKIVPIITDKLNCVVDTDRLIKTNYSLDCVNELIDKIYNKWNNDENLTQNEVLGDLFYLKNNTIQMVPHNSEYEIEINNELNQFINDINNIYDKTTTLQKLSTFKTTLNSITYELTVIDNEIYKRICYLLSVISQYKDTLNNIDSFFSNTNEINFNKIYYNLIRILCAQNPDISKIYNHLYHFYEKFCEDNEYLDTLETIIDRIIDVLQIYIFRKIMIDNLSMHDCNLTLCLDINCFDAYLFGKLIDFNNDTNQKYLDELIYKRDENVIFKIYIDQDYIYVNDCIDNLFEIVRINVPNQIILYDYYDSSNIYHNDIYNLFKNLIDEKLDLCIDDTNELFLDTNYDELNKNNAKLWCSSTFNLPKKEYYVRYTANSVEFLDVITCNLIFKVEDKKDIDDSNADTNIDKLLIEYIKENIYIPKKYFSKEHSCESNMYFLHNLSNILSFNKIYNKDTLLINIVISELNKIYNIPEEYTKLDGYKSIINTLQNDLIGNFETVKSKYEEIMLLGVKYNMFMMNNIMRLLCAENLTIDFMANLDTNTNILEPYNIIKREDVFIGNLEFEKIVDIRYNKSLSVKFFNAWGNYMRILNDVGNLEELVDCHDTNFTDSSYNNVDFKNKTSKILTKLSSYNVYYNYVNFAYKTLIEKISIGYADICNKYLIGDKYTGNLWWKTIFNFSDTYLIQVLNLNIANFFRMLIIEFINKIKNYYLIPTKILSNPEQPKLIKVEMADGSIFEKYVSFCIETDTNDTNKCYECFELVPLTDISTTEINNMIYNIINIIHYKFEYQSDINALQPRLFWEIRNEINKSTNELLNSNELDSNDTNNFFKGGNRHFLYTYFTNSDNFKEMVENDNNKRLNIKNILLFLKKIINEIPENATVHNNKLELRTILKYIKKATINFIDNISLYAEKIEDDVIKKNFNDITPEYIINSVLNKSTSNIKKDVYNKPNINKTSYKNDVKCSDYTYNLYIDSYEVFEKKLENNPHIFKLESTEYNIIPSLPFIIELESFFEYNFSWFYRTITDDWVIKNYAGSVMYDSIAKIKSSLRKDTKFTYDIIERPKNVECTDISYKLDNLNLEKIKPMVILTRKLLNKYLGYPYNNCIDTSKNRVNEITRISNILQKVYNIDNSTIFSDYTIYPILYVDRNRNCYVQDYDIRGILDIYEKENQWIELLLNTKNTFIKNNFSRSEIIENILNNLLDKYDTNIDILCDTNTEKISDTKPFSTILEEVFSEEFCRCRQVEDFFGYKSSKPIQQKCDDKYLFTNIVYKVDTNTKEYNYSVLKCPNIPSYYFVKKFNNSYYYSQDPNLLEPIKTCFPVLYHNNDIDKLNLAFLDYENENYNDEGYLTFIEKNTGQILYYNDDDKKYYYPNDTNPIDKKFIHNSDENGNIKCELNIIKRKWIIYNKSYQLYYILDEKKNKSYLYKLNNKYYYEKDNKEYTDSNYPIHNIYTYYLYNTEKKVETKKIHKLYYYYDDDNEKLILVFKHNNKYYYKENENELTDTNIISLLRGYYLNDVDMKNNVDMNNNVQYYDFLVKAENSNLWSNGNSIYFSDGTTEYKLNNNGSWNIIQPNLDNIYPVLAVDSNNINVKKLILKRENNITTFIKVIDLIADSNDSNEIKENNFPINLEYKTMFPYPLHYLNPICINRICDENIVNFKDKSCRGVYKYCEVKRYEFYIKIRKRTSYYPNLWKYNNIQFVFTDNCGNLFYMDNNGQFTDSSNNIYNGIKSKLIPVKETDTNNSLKITLIQSSDNIIKYYQIYDLDNQIHPFPPYDDINFITSFIYLQYDPDIPDPIDYLICDTNDTTKDDKIVLKYDCSYIIESNEEPYEKIPIYESICHEEKEEKDTLQPVLVSNNSDIFDCGDANGISMEFYNNSNYTLECLKKFAEVFCDFAPSIEDIDKLKEMYGEDISKLSVTKAYLDIIIKQTKDNNLFLDNQLTDIDEYKEFIYNYINNEITKLEKKIFYLRTLVPPDGEINRMLFDTEYGKFAWIQRLGHFIINKIEIKIGDQVIDTHYGSWLNVWYELTKKKGHIRGYDHLIGHKKQLFEFNNKIKPKHIMYIPLQFWFCEDSGLYIPLIALHHSQVYINVILRKLEDVAYWEKDTELYIKNNNKLVKWDRKLKCNILSQYIYLDEKERHNYAKGKHEYLIHQLQYDTEEVTTPKIERMLYFNNPCKEFIWNVQLNKFIDGSLENGEKQWYNYTVDKYNYDYDFTKMSDTEFDFIINNKILYKYNKKSFVNTPLSVAKQSQIKTMGKPRIVSRYLDGYFDNNYLSNVQSYQSHSHTPALGTNLYSFSFYPELIQPSGTINMTKIDDSYILSNIESEINSKKDWGKIHIYTRNYNVLRVMSGLSGLAYSF